MVNTNIDIFEISYEESVSYFKLTPKSTRLDLKPKLGLERSLWPSLFFSKKLMHLKGSCNSSLKRLQAVGREQARLNPSSIFSTENNLTISTDEETSEEYLSTFSKPFSSSKTKLAKSSHPTMIH
jgi:DNA polymerase III delta subunit